MLFCQLEMTYLALFSLLLKAVINTSFHGNQPCSCFFSLSFSLMLLVVIPLVWVEGLALHLVLPHALHLSQY